MARNKAYGMLCRMWPETARGGIRPSTAAPPAIRGYVINQRLRKRVDEIFGWMKTFGNLRKTLTAERKGWAECSLSWPRRSIWCAYATGRRRFLPEPKRTPGMR